METRMNSYHYLVETLLNTWDGPRTHKVSTMEKKVLPQILLPTDPDPKVPVQRRFAGMECFRDQRLQTMLPRFDRCLCLSSLGSKQVGMEVPRSLEGV
jgi:hypothetical protein